MAKLENLDKQVGKLEADSGVKVRTIAKWIGLALGSLLIILLAYFVLWPLRGVKSPQIKTEVVPQKYLPLTFTVQNTTQSGWVDVTMRVQGKDFTAEGSDTAKLESNELNISDSASISSFSIGDIKAGRSKDVTVNILAASMGTHEYTASFITTELVAGPETKSLTFK